MSQDHTHDTAPVDAEREQQHEDRTHTDERLAMDGADMEDSIDHEMDQKVEPGDESRYEGDVDGAATN